MKQLLCINVMHYVSVNSKPDQPAGKTPRQYFYGRIPHPLQKRSSKPPPRAYEN